MTTKCPHCDTAEAKVNAAFEMYQKMKDERDEALRVNKEYARAIRSLQADIARLSAK